MIISKIQFPKEFLLFTMNAIVRVGILNAKNYQMTTNENKHERLKIIKKSLNAPNNSFVSKNIQKLNSY